MLFHWNHFSSNGRKPTYVRSTAVKAAGYKELKLFRCAKRLRTGAEKLKRGCFLSYNRNGQFVITQEQVVELVNFVAERVSSSGDREIFAITTDSTRLDWTSMNNKRGAEVVLPTIIESRGCQSIGTRFNVRILDNLIRRVAVFHRCGISCSFNPSTGRVSHHESIAKGGSFLVSCKYHGYPSRSA